MYQSQHPLKVLVRHIPLCREDDGAPTDPCGFSPDCRYSKECWALWTKDDAIRCNGECSDAGHEEASNLEILLLNREMDMVHLHDLIRYCVTQVLHPLDGLQFEIVRGFIVWQNGGPTSSPHDEGARQHSSAITSGHLALMDQRNYGDYIQVDITVLPNDKEDGVRRKSMVKALKKLSKENK
jgi:hypothetical protein